MLIIEYITLEKTGMSIDIDKSIRLDIVNIY